MQRYDPAPELALDMAMLEGVLPCARTWIPAGSAAVLGVASQVAEEIVPGTGIVVRRRSSGGSTVLLSRRMVCFAVVLPKDRSPRLDTIGGTYDMATAPVISALRSIDVAARLEKPGDLSVGDRKICGLAQSRRRGAVLVHGVIPVVLEPGELERYLLHPPQEPDYRRGRAHSCFVADIAGLCGVESPEIVTEALERAFRDDGLAVGADERSLERARVLVADKYGTEEWTYRR